ncbi:MAG TPA: PilZ domain-containing protein [Dyella sp.]|uniref:PilZ domain-containing protein n=1 Tax=Dyella sp. TaxID=1869338 RepID=UPI002F9589E2
MSQNVTSMEQRRARRRAVDFTTIVTDAITGKPIGQLGNLSTTGMLLIAAHAPRSDAIYQVSLPLPGPGRVEPIELGIQEQWHESTPRAGQIWAGFRIIAIEEHDAARLANWVENSGAP